MHNTKGHFSIANLLPAMFFRDLRKLENLEKAKKDTRAGHGHRCPIEFDSDSQAYDSISSDAIQ